MDKLISGMKSCECDRRYKPKLMIGDNYYAVKCGNCGQRAPSAPRPSWSSHEVAKKKAIELWNLGERV